MYNFHQLLFLFFIYSFLGWCVEVCYRSVKDGKFVNSGFLNGAYCPIYGFGMLIIIGFLTPIQHSLPLLFAGAFVLTSALELSVGWALHKLFKTRWWDYTKKPFNIGGYICLEFSILWGMGACFVMKLVHPIISAAVGAVNAELGVFLLVIMSAVMLVDTFATVSAILKLNGELEHLDKLAREMRERSDSIAQRIGTAAIEADEIHDEIMLDLQARLDLARADIVDAKIKSYCRIVKAFPDMHHDNCDEQLKELKIKLLK